MRNSQILLVFLASFSGCGPSSLELPALELDHPGFFPTRGIVPCAHPTARHVDFGEVTALGISAEDAFARLDGECTAPFIGPDGETEVAVKVELDRASAREVTYPPSDVCINKLTVEGDVVVKTADGKLHVGKRGTFTFVPGGGPKDDPLPPLELPAELSVSDGNFVVSVGPACAGEIRPQGSQTITASWSATGCPLGTQPVDIERPEVAVRMEQLAKAWRAATLAAAWDTGDKTELELDVRARDAVVCENHYRLVTVPVDVRFGTSDGVIPVHDRPGQVQFSLQSNEPTVRLLVTEDTDCSTQSAAYCESLSSASLRLEISYPNAPTQRLARLLVQGQLRGSRDDATTRRALTIAGSPYAVECLLELDCAVDQTCADGFCRPLAKTQTRSSCVFDSECGISGHCRAGSCSAL